MANPSQQVGQGAPSRLGAGRKRNTMNNKMSKQGLGDLGSAVSGGDLPLLDPSAVASYYGQLQTLQSQLSTQLAGLRQQRVGFKGEARVARSDIRQQGQEALSGVVGSAIERGVLGSSAELEQRAETRAATSSGLADVNRQLYDALAESRLQAEQARLGFTQGTQQLAAGAIASRMQMAAQEKQNQISIRIARMQAAAQATTDAAQMDMARKQLRIARQEKQGLKALADNPYNPYPQLGAGPAPRYMTRQAALASGSGG
ncbi:MAG TPA: hypothetical protein VGC81_10955 [Candidatus Methylomirabilis sp.]